MRCPFANLGTGHVPMLVAHARSESRQLDATPGVVVTPHEFAAHGYAAGTGELQAVPVRVVVDRVEPA